MKEKQIILVIDDEMDITLLFRRMLEEEGYKILTANNGVDSLKILETEKPDLIFLDLKLPDMDGIKILHLIKKRDKNIEVIIITGYGALKTVRQAMALGAYDYITKPPDFDNILALVKETLSPDVN